MIAVQEMSSADLCATLFFRLVNKGYSTSEVEHLVKDTYSIIKNGGYFTLETLNKALLTLGWDSDAMDSFTLNILFNLLQKSFNIEVIPHSIN